MNRACKCPFRELYCYKDSCLAEGMLAFLSTTGLNNYDRCMSSLNKSLHHVLKCLLLFNRDENIITRSIRCSAVYGYCPCFSLLSVFEVLGNPLIHVDNLPLIPSGLIPGSLILVLDRSVKIIFQSLLLRRPIA